MQSNILTTSYIPFGSETFNGAVDPARHGSAGGVDHRRLHIPMPEQFLNRPDVVAVIQQMRGAGAP